MAAIADTGAKTPDLQRLRRMFEDSRDLTKDDRAEALVSEEYYNCKQFTPAELTVLKTRKQPIVTINRVRTAINSLLGIMEQGKSDPRCYLRNPALPTQQPAQPMQGGPPPPGAPMPPGASPAPTQAPPPSMGQPMPGQVVMGGNGGPPLDPVAPPPTEDAGDVATKVLRYIGDQARFHRIKMAAFKDGLIAGRQAAIVECSGPNADVKITQIRWEEFFYDPYSRKDDFSDARYLGVAKWLYADQLKLLYNNIDGVGEGVDGALAGNMISPDWTWEDRPNSMGLSGWVDNKAKRLMVVDLYHREAEGWQRSAFYAGGLLESGPSPYTDEHDAPTCPIEGMSVYIDEQNARHGVIRDMRGPQDEINMRRSKALHILNSRQIQESAPGSGMGDADEARAEAARPDGVIPPGWQIVNTAQQMAGQVEMQSEAKSEMERLTPAPGVLARQGADSSGRAVLARQAAGMTEHAPVLGGQQDWELRVYKQCWARARQFWNGPKWIRITNDLNAPQYILINEPAGADPMTGEQKLNNNIADTDVDIIIDSVKDTATLQQETFSELMQLLQSSPTLAQAFPPATIIKLSSIANKQEVLDDLEQAQAQAHAAQAQQAQQAQAMQQQKFEAEIRKMMTEAIRNIAAAKNDDAKAELDRRDARLPPDPPPATPAATGDFGLPVSANPAGPPP